MVDFPVRLFHAFQLRRAERLAIKLDRARRVLDAQEGGHAMPTRRNRFHFAHHNWSPCSASSNLSAADLLSPFLPTRRDRTDPRFLRTDLPTPCPRRGR